MKVILKKDVDNLGDAGEVVDVADGYGNNYLMPRGLAMRATKGALADAEVIRRARSKRAEVSYEQAEQEKAELEASPVNLSAKAGEDGQLYGSVGVTALAKAIQQQLGLNVEKKRLRLERPLKSVGEHEVPVHVYRDVEATLRVEITPAAE